MTLPASGFITMENIVTELSTTPPLAMGAAIPRLLAQKPIGQIAMTDFYGRSCTTLTVSASSTTSTSGNQSLVGFGDEVSIPAPDFGGMPQRQFRAMYIDAFYQNRTADTFSIWVKNDNNGGVQFPANYFYAVYVNDTIFYSADATIGGTAGGRTIWSWATADVDLMSFGQVYTVRFFY